MAGFFCGLPRRSYGPPRLALGLFQTQVGQRCGWKHEGLYVRLETGAQETVTPTVMAKIAKALECDVKDLLARRR